MQVFKIEAQKRKKLSKQNNKQLRKEKNIPALLYGKGINLTIYVSQKDVKKLVYTPDIFFIHLYLEKAMYQCLLQDVHFSPVTDEIMHIDFLNFDEQSMIKIKVPIKLTGRSAGVEKGGELAKKKKKLTLKGLPKDIPEKIILDITTLDFNKPIRVENVETKNFQILENKSQPIVSVTMPRALKTEANKEA